MTRAERYDDAIHALETSISALVLERQEMRASYADAEELESNRLELVRRQQQLSCALIARHLPSSAPRNAQQEHKRSLGSRSVFADKLLAA
jgi:hypothetical protein